jgi:serine/threonine-protein kinase
MIISSGRIGILMKMGEHMTRKLGNYSVIEEIGRGGMAVVYRAVQESLNRTVAIKELDLARFRGEPSALERFRLEARTAASLEHPNIITIYDLWEEADKAFIAMEFVDGAELKEVMGTLGKLDPVEAALVMIEICGALSFAHGKGMIHRDVKPANIMLSATGEVKLMDFGIVSVPDSGELTMAGQILGTPAYMAPEQITGEQQLGPQADIFSLGAIFYESLTGAKPFIGPNHIALIQSILHNDPVPPGDLVPGIPETLSQIIERCLQKNPEARFGTMDELSTVVEMSLPLARVTRKAAVSRMVERHRDPESTALRTPAAGPEDMTAPFAVAGLQNGEPTTPGPEAQTPAHPLELDPPADLPPLEPFKDTVSVPRTYQKQPTAQAPLELRYKTGQEDVVETGTYVDDRKGMGTGMKIAAAALLLLVFAAGARFFLNKGGTGSRPDTITDLVQLGKGARLIVASEFGGQVYINGKKVGEIDSTAAFEMDPGFHSLEVEHPEYGSKKFILELEPGERERVIVEFLRR